MKCKLFVLFCSLLLFCSCSSISVTDSALNNVENSLVSLEKSLPVECKSEDIIGRFKAISDEISTVRAGIETQLDVERADKVKWRVAFWALLVSICAFIVGKFIL